MTLAILARIWPYLLAAALALGSYLWADLRCWNRACHSQQARADKLQTEADAAKKRATDLALLWANTLQKADDDTRTKLAAQRQEFAALEAQAKALGPLPDIVLAGPTVVVLDRITAAANSAAPEVDNGASTSISQSDLAQRWAEAGAAYLDATTKLTACIKAYEGIRNVQVH
jgi:hypothetical protein